MTDLSDDVSMVLSGCWFPPLSNWRWFCLNLGSTFSREFCGKGKATEFDLEDFPGSVLKTDHFFSLSLCQDFTAVAVIY